MFVGMTLDMVRGEGIRRGECNTRCVFQWGAGMRDSKRTYVLYSKKDVFYTFFIIKNMTKIEIG
jgi:hypothetical protein